MAQTPKTSTPTGASSSQRKLHIAVAVVLAVILLSLVSAFGWPGWALNKSAIPQARPSINPDAKPTVSAQPLPESSSQLVQALPEHMANYVRGEVSATDVWQSSQPLEEYKVTYTQGQADKDVEVVVAQWSSTEESQKQYSALAKAMTGEESASGNIKVSGKNCGTYVVRADPDNAGRQIALWRNDTVVFQASGAKDGVELVYQLFPM